MMKLDIADISRTIAHDNEGLATRAILGLLREAADPLQQTLRTSFSAEDQRLSRDLSRSIQKAERALIAAWKRMHPGRQWGPR